MKSGFCVIQVLLSFGVFFGTACGEDQNKKRLLLISFDGFRWDYVGNFRTPNLDSFAAEGVHAPVGVRTAFVTKTFPDHYTLATGLYEESHGIISNQMYDPVLNASFSPGNVEPRWWNGGQPIWTTSTLQGVRTGAYFWPGSEVSLEGVRPFRLEPYDKKVPFTERVDTIVEWLMEDDVDFVVCYFHEPDQAGHRFGVMTPNVGEAVQKVDNVLGYLIKKLKEDGVYDNTNILIVSDHGMTNVTADGEHLIVVADILNLDEDIVIMPDEGALANILPRPDRMNHVFNKLSNAHPNLTVYRKEDIPERFHYKHHRRILPLVLLADEGYYITKTREHSEIGPGEHGYDNGLSSMRPIFFARGPDFKAGYQVPSSFETVNIYPLICHLLNLKPAPNNGSLEPFLEMLVQSSAPISLCTSFIFCILSVLFSCKYSRVCC